MKKWDTYAVSITAHATGPSTRTVRRGNVWFCTDIADHRSSRCRPACAASSTGDSGTRDKWPKCQAYLYTYSRRESALPERSGDLAAHVIVTNGEPAKSGLVDAVDDQVDIGIDGERIDDAEPENGFTVEFSGRH